MVLYLLSVGLACGCAAASQLFRQHAQSIRREQSENERYGGAV